MHKDIIAYYRQRAKEYEKIYHKPERKDNLFQAEMLLHKIFANREVIEIACGTGFWTERIAKAARSILATDINDTVIEIAQSKAYPPLKVSFRIADLYKIPAVKRYESLFGGFIWSHIPLEELSSFINVINNLVVPGGMVVLMDNNYVEGSNLPITHTDENGNTWQTRQLEDGTRHKVLKNFPTDDFLHHVLKDKATDIRVINLKYYWILVYRTPAS